MSDDDMKTLAKIRDRYEAKGSAAAPCALHVAIMLLEREESGEFVLSGETEYPLVWQLHELLACASEEFLFNTFCDELEHMFGEFDHWFGWYEQLQRDLA